MAKTEAGMKVKFSTRTEDFEGKVTSKDFRASITMEGTQAMPFEIAQGDWSSDKETARTSAMREAARKLKRTMHKSVVRVVNGHIFLLLPSPVLPDLEGEWQINWEVYIIKAATHRGSGGEGCESWVGTLETAWTPDFRETWEFWEKKKANHYESDRKALIAKKEEDEVVTRLQVVGE